MTAHPERCDCDQCEERHYESRKPQGWLQTPSTDENWREEAAELPEESPCTEAEIAAMSYASFEAEHQRLVELEATLPDLPEFDSYPGPTIAPPSRMSVHPISLLTPEARENPTRDELIYLLEQARNMLQAVHATLQPYVDSRLDRVDEYEMPRRLGRLEGEIIGINISIEAQMRHIQHTSIIAGTEGGTTNGG